jgi:KipI family sensor histidine kinase inhibitor
MTFTPRIVTAGDRVIVVEYGDGIDEALNAHVHRVARAMARRARPGVVEVVPTYRSCAVHVDPLVVSPDDVAADVTTIERDLAVMDPGAAIRSSDELRTVEVPVAYGGAFGPDLDDVAAHCGLQPDEVVAIHAAGTYRVYMMGFTPGFPYLGGMSPRIAAPRLSTPRTSVPAGSVGIAAQQTGVYPTSSPGGWRLIGRTPLRLFDPCADPPCLVDAGDLVRFVPVSDERFRELAADHQPGGPDGLADASEGIEVLDGGMLTTVQDTGRAGYQRFGVPVAGAMDVFALRCANRLAGNADDEAGLEMTLVGPALRFDVDTVAALAGADLDPRLNDRPLRIGQAFPVRRGDTLTCAGQRRGIRSYLSVRGGITVPQVLRSRATYLASAFGGFQGRALRAGDRLPVLSGNSGGPVRIRAAEARSVAPAGHDLIVRVMMGPQDDAFTVRGRETFLSATYTLSVRSDRVGCRLDGPRIEHRTGPDIVSDGTAFGAVQVAGDGQPIVLMADRGTTGGYTKIATVMGADLHVVAQALPGDRVRFHAVDRDVAVAALRDQEAWLDSLRQDDHRPEWDGGVFDEDSGAAWAAEGMAPLAAALRGRADVTAKTPSGVRAGMAGLVVSVSVTAGAVVAERDTLLVIEAMKMQNPIRAPRAGRVAHVHVAVGTQVSAQTVVIGYED